MAEIYTLFRKHGLTPEVVSSFQTVIRDYYQEHGRVFPWRETTDPYYILVSEFMLQQTQTSRVVEKYIEFISDFPDVFQLARSPFREVLRIWQGLGYNRRALALHKTAGEVVDRYHGWVPDDPALLSQLPGVGEYTTAAMMAIAFNKPAVVIDTNIRTVYLYFFFRETETVGKSDIVPLIEATLDRNSPREWYYALFDYGLMLKREKKDLETGKRRKQSTFRGSDRELRGNILRLLLDTEVMTEDQLLARLLSDEDRVRRIVSQLYEEGLLDRNDGVVRIRQQ
ncbi:A/G-specific adenine glycosylase [Chloroflexota bacterium]